MKNLRKNQGITLIALVITIIVMLILVAVTITIAINGGIFDYAKRARDEKIISDEKEKISLSYFNAKIEKRAEELDDRDFQIALDSQVGEGKTNVTINDKGKIKIVFKDTNHIYIIDEEKIIKQDPLELHIKSSTDLYNFATRVNNGEDFKDYFVYLDNDIQLEEEDWIVIGTPGDRDTPGQVFKGLFEGNNHKISNVKFSNSKSHMGLFDINSGIIQNLNIEGNISSTTETFIHGRYVGFIAAKNGGKISNCTSTVIINNLGGIEGGYTSGFGGIVGTNYGTIDNCITKGQIRTHGENSTSTGGIAGTNTGKISNCKNYAQMDIASSRGGGIAGESGNPQGTPIIEKCINYGNIKNSGNYKGGIVGELSGGIIDSCANRGEFYSENQNNKAGGICGRIRRDVSTITNCYNTGRGYYVLGIFSGIAADYSDNPIIQNCYTRETFANKESRKPTKSKF